MRHTVLYSLLIICLIANATVTFGQVKGINKGKAFDLLTIQAYSTNPDSVIIYPFDSTINSVYYRMKYVKQKDLINFFSPFYDNDICAPGNNAHPLYKNYITEGNKVLPLAKEKCMKELATSEVFNKKIRGLLKDTSELRKCTFTLIPTYYLTYNVVSYSGEDEKGFTSFFNLDTAYFQYLVIKDNILVYRFKYKNGIYSGLTAVSSRDSLQYSFINKLGKNPIGINSGLTSPQFRGVYYGLGYVNDKKLVLLSCRHGMYYKDRTSSERSFVSECKTIPVKSYYINKNDYLFQVIENAYQTLVGHEKVKPLPGMDVKLKVWSSE